MLEDDLSKDLGKVVEIGTGTLARDPRYQNATEWWDIVPSGSLHWVGFVGIRGAWEAQYADPELGG